MRNIRFGFLGALLACLGVTGCGSLGSMSSGQMDWVQPETQANRAGTVYLVRGWMGIFSGGMDRLGEEIDKTGVNARVYQHDQCAQLAKTMAERYRNSPNHEPICMIGHSFGSDDSLIIARELDKVGVPVDLIIIMDAVNETVVPKNVKLCINYWQPGIFGDSNFLRGIPLTQEPGSTGKLINMNLFEEGKDLREPTTNHINIDEAPKLHKAIIEHILATCPTRSVWAAAHPGSQLVTPVVASSRSDDGVRTAAAHIGPSAGKTIAK
jgi:hypothetical protein